MRPALVLVGRHLRDRCVARDEPDITTLSPQRPSDRLSKASTPSRHHSAAAGQLKIHWGELYARRSPHFDK